MNKTALVLLPVAALAIVILVFAVMARRDASPASGDLARPTKVGGGDAGSAESARLREEVEALRKEVEATRKRAEEAELKLAEASAIPAAADPAKEPKKAAAKKGDWKTRRDAELEAKVKSMEWRKNVKGLVDYWRELEKSRAEGRSPRMSPDLVAQLTQLNKDAAELHKFLAIEGGNVYDSFKNEVVSEAWVDSFLQEVSGGTLTEEQLVRLRATSPDDNQEPDIMDGNLFESWKYLIKHNQAYGTETAGLLTPEQQGLVSKTVTPTFMLSVYAAYSERTVSGPAAVADYWLDSFKLPVEQRAAVDAVAGDFTKRLAELNQAYASQYGATLPRDADFELRLKALDLQMAAEKQLVEGLNLDAETLKKFLKGSGSVIKLAN
jgi:hypothetical protein